MRKSVLAGLLAAVLAPGLVLTDPASSRADPPAVAAAKPYLGTMIGPMEKENQPGAVVREVTPNSPAAKAGLKEGDIILKVDDQEVKNAGTLVGMIATHKPGDSLKLHIRRDGKEQDVNAVLAAHPAPVVLPRTEFSDQGRCVSRRLARPMTAEQKEKLGVAADKGAVVMLAVPDSPAAKAGSSGMT